MRGYCSVCGEHTTVTSYNEELICEQCRNDLDEMLRYGKERYYEELEERRS